MFTLVCWDNPTNSDGFICTRRGSGIELRDLGASLQPFAASSVCAALRWATSAE